MLKNIKKVSLLAFFASSLIIQINTINAEDNLTDFISSAKKQILLSLSTTALGVMGFWTSFHIPPFIRTSKTTFVRLGRFRTTLVISSFLALVTSSLYGSQQFNKYSRLQKKQQEINNQ